jgi:hypothetical protein
VGVEAGMGNSLAQSKRQGRGQWGLLNFYLRNNGRLPSTLIVVVDPKFMPSLPKFMKVPWNAFF